MEELNEQIIRWSEFKAGVCYYPEYWAKEIWRWEQFLGIRLTQTGSRFMFRGMFGNLNNHRMTEESLDFYTYDSYPNFAYCLEWYKDESRDMRNRKWSRNLSEVRLVSPIFGIMEQQSGANGWNNRMETPTQRPGQITLWTMQYKVLIYPNMTIVTKDLAELLTKYVEADVFAELLEPISAGEAEGI